MILFSNLGLFFCFKMDESYKIIYTSIIFASLFIATEIAIAGAVAYYKNNRSKTDKPSRKKEGDLVKKL